jgi:hypothetical protein
MATSKCPQVRIIELEEALDSLRKSALLQRNMLNNYSCAPDIHEMLRTLHRDLLDSTNTGEGNGTS